MNNRILMYGVLPFMVINVAAYLLMSFIYMDIMWMFSNFFDKSGDGPFFRGIFLFAEVFIAWFVWIAFDNKIRGRR